MAPSMTTPAVTYFHSATSSLSRFGPVGIARVSIDFCLNFQSSNAQQKMNKLQYPAAAK
jgi:hypothetical protein